MRALLVCFYFPPIQGSTGSLRTLSLARYLPAHGWEPIVLTVVPSAYVRSESSNASLLPDALRVYRTRAWDVAQVLSVKGRYPRFLGYPDRWQSWFLTAVRQGLKLCRSERPSVLYSTYPTPTTHLVAYALHQLTGIPWVAEFRDPMVEENYPSNRFERRIRQWIERRVARYAARIVTVTEGCAEMYRSRYPQVSDRVVVVENGYEDYLAGDVPAVTDSAAAESQGAPLVLLHSGVVYPAERDPHRFFEALARLKAAGEVDASMLRVVFRGAGNEEQFGSMASELGVSDLVEFLPTIPYVEASAEMQAADALLILQGRVCNRQIPAKAYEYLYRRKPILALADPAGDTARMLAQHGVGQIAALEDVAAMVVALRGFLMAWRCGDLRPSMLDQVQIEGLSRRARAAEMANVFDSAAGTTGPATG